MTGADVLVTGLWVGVTLYALFAGADFGGGCALALLSLVALRSRCSPSGPASRGRARWPPGP